MLQVQALTKQFRGPQGRQVLARLDLHLVAEEYVAIMGPSGSGKSTLLNVLGGLLRPDAGSIRLEGVELSALADNALTRLRRRRIGFVFQAFHLLPHLSAAENIALPLQLDGVARATAMARAQALLEAVELGDRSASLPGELSGGEVQRVAVARALANEPRMLLADEPTGALDSASSERVLDMLFRLRDDLGMTLVVVSYDRSVGARADRTVALVDGGIESTDAALFQR